MALLPRDAGSDDWMVFLVPFKRLKGLPQEWMVFVREKSIFNWDTWRINQLPGKLTVLANLKMAHSQLIYSSKMVIFHSCGSLPEGNGNN